MNPPAWWSEQWWRWFLTIALASFVVGLIFFVTNWFLGKKARHSAERAQRIGEVVDEYVGIVTAHPQNYAGVGRSLSLE